MNLRTPYQSPEGKLAGLLGETAILDSEQRIALRITDEREKEEVIKRINVYNDLVQFVKNIDRATRLSNYHINDEAVALLTKIGEERDAY